MATREFGTMFRLMKGKKNWIKIDKNSIKSLSTSPSIISDGNLSYVHKIGEEPLKYQTIGMCLEESANKWPNIPWVASFEEEKSYTFSQILEQADRVAASFVELGLNPGDRIGICAPNSTNWMITMMAAARANLILVTINPAYQKSELEYCINNVGIKCLLISSKFKSHQFDKTLLELAPEINSCKPGILNSPKLPDLKTIIFIDNKKIPGTFTFDDIISMSNSLDVQKISDIQKLASPDDPCNIQFTSGTTGKPKGACLSHFNAVNSGYIIGRRNHMSEKYHKICGQVPMFHVFGTLAVAMASLQHGSTMIYPSQYYDSKKTLECVAKENCTIMTGTPTMYVDLINTHRSMDVKIKSLEIAAVGGAPCSPQIMKNLFNELNIKYMKSIYGMTESSAISFQSMPNENDYQIMETVGYVQDHIEAKVVDVNGKMVPFGVAGELWVRGYNTMVEYWNNKEKTDETFTPTKWLKTGDQFILQKDGYGKVVGRLKDVIIRGGENIYPKEVEDHLNTHPDILETHIFGVKDERMGEEICAGVRLKDGSNLSLEDMNKYCKGNIANYKIPRSKDEGSYFHSLRKNPLESITIAQAMETAANNWPNKPFIISKHESKEITFSEIYLEADKLSSGMLACGIKPGDRIGIYAPNSTNWFIIMMAAAKIGAVTVAINPASTLKELEHCLRKVGVKCLFMTSSYRNRNNCNMLMELIPELSYCKPGELKSKNLSNLENVILMDNQDFMGTFTFDQVKNIDFQLNTYTAQPEDNFCILFTSGTTGLPKAAIQTHFSYVNNSKDVAYRCEIDKGNDIICLQIPFFHALGLLIVLGSLQYGSTIALPYEYYSIGQAMETIVQNKCSVVTGTPTMYVDLLNYQRENKIKLNSPRIAITGGSPLSPQLFFQMKDQMAIPSIKSVYGMTEVLAGFISMPDDDYHKTTETVGKVMDNFEVKVVDEDGFVVPFGTPGELLIRGYSNMIGYWGDSKKTEEMIDENGWAKTGDQFILEPNGYGRICGRFKDMIIRGGENISPKEIEDVINTHPDVIETQVFGVKDDRMGEEICASVRVKKGSYFDYNKLQSFCSGALARYKIPKYLKIVDDFPKTTSGKIQKFKLKEMVESGKM